MFTLTATTNGPIQLSTVLWMIIGFSIFLILVGISVQITTSEIETEKITPLFESVNMWIGKQGILGTMLLLSLLVIFILILDRIKFYGPILVNKTQQFIGVTTAKIDAITNAITRYVTLSETALRIK